MSPTLPLEQTSGSSHSSLRPGFSGSKCKLAAIDVGTNSIHMVIVDINPEIPSFVITAREKETVRLGEYNNRTGSLTTEAMQRASEALERFITIAHAHQTQSIVAVATSAVREAPNGQEFLHRIEQQLGLTIDLISGQEEARRIYLGVLSAIEFNGLPHVVVDIGGGSTELILGSGREPDFLRSVKVGAVRLTQSFLRSDPPTDRELQTLREYIRGSLEDPIRQIQALLGSNPVRLIGTSGTIETLIALQNRSRSEGTPAQSPGVQLAEVQHFLSKIQTMPLAERQKWPGLIERRAEIIIAGALILTEVMQLLQTDDITFCGRALREGLIVDWMLTQGLIEDRLRFQGSVRERHTRKLAYKYQVDWAYAERVAHFALRLFDQTRGILHPWGLHERAYLWVAAILHNCGHFVSHSAHHKHSYYLIRHGELLGFNEEEVEVIANLARYHRKSPPKKKHENFQRLANETYRQMVLDLSPLLRIATALDRRAHLIQDLRCDFAPSTGSAQVMYLYLQADHPDDGCDLELWSIAQKKEIFEEHFKIRLEPCLEVNRPRASAESSRFSPWLRSLIAQTPTVSATVTDGSLQESYQHQWESTHL